MSCISDPAAYTLQVSAARENLLSHFERKSDQPQRQIMSDVVDKVAQSTIYLTFTPCYPIAGTISCIQNSTCALGRFCFYNCLTMKEDVDICSCCGKSCLGCCICLDITSASKGCDCSEPCQPCCDLFKDDNQTTFQCRLGLDELVMGIKESIMSLGSCLFTCLPQSCHRKIGNAKRIQNPNDGLLSRWEYKPCQDTFLVKGMETNNELFFRKAMVKSYLTMSENYLSESILQNLMKPNGVNVNNILYSNLDVYNPKDERLFNMVNSALIKKINKREEFEQIELSIKKEELNSDLRIILTNDVSNIILAYIGDENFKKKPEFINLPIYRLF